MAFKKKKSPAKKTAKSSVSGSGDWRNYFVSKREKNGNVIFVDKSDKEKMFKNVAEGVSWAKQNR